MNMKSLFIKIISFILLFYLILVFDEVFAASVEPPEILRQRNVDRALKYEAMKYSEANALLKYLSFTATETGQALVAVPMDSDDDGMPDAWELANGLNPNDPDDSWFDPDGDEIVNLFEYQLGSNLNDPLSPEVVTVASSDADYTTIKDALEAVIPDAYPYPPEPDVPGTVIRVSEGTYPVNYMTFSTNYSVMIQGGWNAGFNQRNLRLFPTIFDGGMNEEILYFSSDSGETVVILDGINFVRGNGFFGAVNLLASGTAFMKTSVLNCSITESSSTDESGSPLLFGSVLSMHNWDTSTTDRTIVNTTISGNNASGIGSDINGDALAYWRIINTTISNNLNSGGDNGYGIDAFTLDNGQLSADIYNSIIWGNQQKDVRIYWSNITFNVDNSDIGNVEAEYGAAYTPGIMILNADPLFFDKVNNDYHISSISPMINKGKNTGVPLIDFEGDIRMSGGAVDIGADEYVTSDLSSSPPYKDFGRVDTGKTSRQTFSISNTGTSDLSIGIVTVLGKDSADFSTENDFCSSRILAPLGICPVDVVFLSSEGKKAAYLNIPPVDLDKNPLNVPLSGQGATPSPDIFADPSSGDFGDVNIGDEPVQTFTIGNKGTLDLIIDEISSTGSNASEFIIRNDSCSYQTISPLYTCTVDVAASPASEGGKEAYLHITSNDTDSPSLDLPLSATAKQMINLSLDIPEDFTVPFGKVMFFKTDVPGGFQNLFIVLQKNAFYGTLKIYKNGVLLRQTDGYDDIAIQFENPAPGTYIVELSGSGSGIITARTSLKELKLGEWTVGTIFRQWGSAWYQVSVPSDQDSLSFAVETIGTRSKLEVYYGTLSGRQRWSATGYKMDLKIESPPTGIYYVRLSDSAWIQGDDQKRDFMINADVVPITPPPCTDPVIANITPTKGGTAGPVTVDIKGKCFNSETTVCLEREGQAGICSSNVTSTDDGNELKAEFDLSAASSGEWTLTVTNPDGKTASAQVPFAVESGGEAKLWVEVVGREQIRTDRWTSFIVKYGNLGDVDADYPYLIVAFPKEVEYEIEGNFASISADDDPPVISSDPEAVNMTVFSVPGLPPNSEGSIVIKVKAATVGEWKLRAYITSDQKIIYSSMLTFAKSLFEDLTEESASQYVESKSLSMAGGEVFVPQKDMSNSPPADYVMFWSKKGGWHAAKSLGDGEFIEIHSNQFSEGDPSSDPDINIKRLEDNPYPGWDYWGAYKIRGTTLSKEVLRKRVDKLREKYGIDVEDKINKCEYQDGFCSSRFEKDKLIRTYCWGLVFALNYDNIYMENGWIGPNEVYDNVKEKTEASWYKRMGGGISWGAAISEWIEYRRHLEGIKSGIEKVFQSITSISPEDKYGPAGYDPEGTEPGNLNRFIPIDQPMSYKVDFWNKETAPAHTQDVIITDQLDTDLDWDTFKFTEIGFLDKSVQLEPTQYFDIDVKDVQVDLARYYPDDPTLPEKVNLVVNVKGMFDPETGQITWEFHALDPITYDYPEEPKAGFLPPITDTGYEISWVNYTVSPKNGLPTGTQITNQAWVKFDTNPYNPAPPNPDSEIPGYGPYLNTIDSGKPASGIAPLSATQKNTDFTVSWSGSDDTGGSGIKNYDIYVSDNGGVYSIWTTAADTSVTFTGECGHQYSFYSRAHDNVGNVEDTPMGADASTAVALCPYTLNVKKIGSGNGIVTSSDGKINNSNFSAQYAKNIIVPLTAIPDENSILKKWIGCTRIKRDGTCTVIIGANGKMTINVKAKFAAKKK